MPSRRPGKNAPNNKVRPSVSQKRPVSERGLLGKLAKNKIHPGTAKVKKTTATKKKIKPPARNDRRNK